QGQTPARDVPITGRIIDLEGRPVAGATVQITFITRAKGDDLTAWIEAVKRGEPPWIADQNLVHEPPITPEEKQPKATTDAQGRFRLIGLPKGLGNRLLIVPNDDQPYFMQEVAVPDPPGIAPVPVEIALHKGIWIQGKVTDKETGEPVGGARLHYFPFLENPFAQANPGFDNNGSTGGTSSYQQRYQTKADGTYRL